MKNQYFGDINDYKKYGILRILSGGGAIKTSVCWMLTPDNDKNEGKFITYLNKPDKWRAYDSELFDSLLKSISLNTGRSVKSADQLKLIDNAEYFEKILGNLKVERQNYFQEFDGCTAGSDLIFFDPDNGIEVDSFPAGRLNSGKYIYWKEIIKYYQDGHSLLVYQHFPRIRRDIYINSISEKINARLRTDAIIYYQTANVLFILIPQKQKIDYFLEKTKRIESTWKNEVKCMLHSFK